jgi:bifunctional non-homologous end joining protein LigD
MEWGYEIKWDGFRVLALKDGADVRLLSRNNVDLTKRFPSVASSLSRLNARGALLDGELVALDERGVPSFQALMSGRRGSAKQHHFFAFDLLHLDGRDLRALTLPLPTSAAPAGIPYRGLFRKDGWVIRSRDRS